MYCTKEKQTPSNEKRLQFSIWKVMRSNVKWLLTICVCISLMQRLIGWRWWPGSSNRCRFLVTYRRGGPIDRLTRRINTSPRINRNAAWRAALVKEAEHCSSCNLTARADGYVVDVIYYYLCNRKFRHQMK